MYIYHIFIYYISIFIYYIDTKIITYLSEINMGEVIGKGEFAGLLIFY